MKLDETTIERLVEQITREVLILLKEEAVSYTHLTLPTIYSV